MCKHNNDPVSPCLRCILGLIEDDLWYINEGTERSLNNTPLKLNDYYCIEANNLERPFLVRINKINNTSITTSIIANQDLSHLLNDIVISFTSIRSITRVNIKTDLPLYIHYDYKSEEFNKLLKG